MAGHLVCTRGAGLLIHTGPAEKHHLFALMLDPVIIDGYGSKPMILMACICSIQEGLPFDDSCTLAAGDHPFIRHSSYVDYRFARLEREETLKQKVEEGIAFVKEPFPEDLIRRIIAGALKSRRINREYKRILERVFFQ